MKILIVGGTGVLSYAVVNEALKQGINVTCINRGKSQQQKLSDKVKIIIADYHNEALINCKLENEYFDVVIDVLCFTEEQIEYSINLFKDKCKQYVFMSSCAVYNKGKGDFECNEETELINPLWDYSINKVKCENKLKKLAHEYGLTYTIVRPAVTYGNTRIPYGIMPFYGYHGTIIKRMLNNKPILLWDNGETYSTITRVEDFAKGLVGLLGNVKAYNQAYNIVGDEKYKWKEVLEILGTILNVQPIYFNISKELLAAEMPHKKGEIIGGRGINLLINNSKLKEAVPEFKTTITLKEGLKKTVDYYISHNYIKGIDYAFDADWDRIIKKYGNGSETIGYMDYLGENRVKNKIDYYRSFYKKSALIKTYNLIKVELKKIKKVIS